MLRGTVLAHSWRRPGSPIVVSASAQDVLRALSGDSLGEDRPRRRSDIERAGREARFAAHLLVRWCAARMTGRSLTAFEVRHRCAECGSADHGQPFLDGAPQLHISLAHRPGAVVAAVGTTPVGVDLEVPGTPPGAAVPVPDLMSPLEITQVREAADPALAFLRLWVCKECLVKLGVATLDSLGTVDLAGRVGHPLAGGGTVTRLGRLHLADWVDGSTGAVVAAVGSRPPVHESFPTPDRRC
jgi:4'-phosphopantetheinyl transferase